MPRFFVPLCASQDQAADTYASLVEMSSHPLAHSGSRLFRVAFHYEERTVLAEVGENLEGWRESIGPVIGIVETTRLIHVYVLPSPRAPTPYPILVSPGEVVERVYFDDYPRRQP
jgi:hypothetical protein